MVQIDSLTDMPISWLLLETIDIDESPIDNIIFLMNPLVQTSNHSPKNSDRDMHASRTYCNSPIKLGSESLPLCFMDLRHNNNTKAPQNKKEKNIKPPSLDR